MHYLFLTLSLLSSLTIALLLRVFENKGYDRTVVIASNYIAAGTLGYLLSDPDKTDLTQPTLLFGIVVGFFFFIGFIALSRAIKEKGIASSVTIGRLSLAIPVCLSIFLWGEKPFLMDILGLVLIFFIILSWEGKIGKLSPILLSLFFLFGLLDSAMKFFKLQFPSVDDGFFLVILFYSAMAWSWGYIFFSGKKLKPPDVFWGLLLGIPNFFSTYFLLKALVLIPAYIVFPFVNTGMIILSALSGHVLFKEELNRKKIILILLGIAAVLFLTT
jgi:drug/metabolite transporter (DMT)-like permease